MRARLQVDRLDVKAARSATTGTSTLLAPPTAVIDGAQRIVLWSQSCAAWTGWSAKDVGGIRLRDLLGISVAVGPGSTIEVRVEGPSPRPPIAWTAASLPRAGAVPWTVVMGVDHLERNRARTEHVHARPLAPGARLPMWAFDRGSFEIIAVNEATIHPHNLSADRWLGLRVYDLLGDDDVGALLSALIDLTGEVMWTGPWRVRGGLADEMHLAMVASEDAGRPIGIALGSGQYGGPGR